MTHHTEAERAAFSVSVLYDAANYTNVVADSPEAAAIAAEEEFGIVSLCCQCTGDIGLGDIVGAHVYKDGQLVLDTTSEGRITQELADANARIAELTLELQAARRAPALPVPQGWKMVPVEPPQEALYAIGRLVDDPRAFEDSESFWDYLLAAAPQPPEAAPHIGDCENEVCTGCMPSMPPVTPEEFSRDIAEMVAAPVQMPEPDAWRYTDARGHYRYRGMRPGFAVEYPLLKPEPLYTEQQVRQLLAAHDIQEQST